MRYFNEARAFYSEGELDEALEHLDKALKRSPEFADPALMAGQIWVDRNDIDRANQYFDRAWQASGAAYVAFQAGLANYSFGEYARSLEFLQAYVQSEKARQAYVDAAEKAMADCRFALEAMKHPSDFEPLNMGGAVNSAAMEYFPSISADGLTLVFTYRNPEATKRDEDFFYSTLIDSVWQASGPLPGRLNTALNEGAQSVSADGNRLFFVGCNRMEGKGSCDIYTAIRREDGSWSQAVNMGDSINTANWETQPSISPDGRTLYFIRGAKRDPKSSDLWYSTLHSNGYWTRARRMPSMVNSPGRESSPFIHFDNQTLYFSSDGRVGMGSLDFFVTRKQNDGSWSEPQNLGFPINGPGEEVGLVISADGSTAYYSSDMEGGYGSLDLYTFEMPREYRPVASAWVKGRVTDESTGKPLQAELVFIDLESGEEYYRTTSDRNGRYFAVLPGNTNYALNVDRKDYLFHSENFALKAESKERAFELDVALQALKQGSRITLRNVFFETASYALEKESFVELDKVVELLQRHPEVRVVLEGHTDNEGDDESNQRLSENRARAVRTYLVEKGIKAERLESAGFGESRPVDTNETAEGRQNNRRTELRIL